MYNNTDITNVTDVTNIGDISSLADLINVYRALSAFIGFIVFYLFLALGYYEIFFAKKIPGGKKLRIVAFCASFAGLLYQIGQQISLAMSGFSISHCFAISVTEVALFLVFVSLSYGFFWMRQHIFYSNPKLNHLRNKTIMVSSGIALILIILNPILLVALQFPFSVYRVEKKICLYLDHLYHFRTVFDAVAFSYAFIQVVLLVLFIYPLCKQANISARYSGTNVNSSNVSNNNNIKNKREEIDNSSKSDIKSDDFSNLQTTQQQNSAVSTQVGNERKSSTQKENFMKGLKKWIILSFICIITDAASALVIALSHQGYFVPSSVQIIYIWIDFSVVVNIVCITGCFSEWSLMLFPFRCCNKQHDNQLCSQSTSSPSP